MPTISRKFLTNDAYGYPRGKGRRVKPVVLLVIHQTANVRADADAEVAYANRAGSSGPSATFYLSRDGQRFIQAIDTAYAPWTNGDLNKPDWTAPGMAAVKVLTDKGYNANEAAYATVEVSTYKSVTDSVSPEQIKSLAWLAVGLSKTSGIRISPSTIHLHAYYNSVDRSGCPVTPAKRKAFFEAFFAEVAHLQGLAPAPTTPDTKPTPTSPCASVEAELFRVKAELAKTDAALEEEVKVHAKTKAELAAATKRIAAAQAALSK